MISAYSAIIDTTATKISIIIISFMGFSKATMRFLLRIPCLCFAKIAQA
jgi:hypothetical protein